MERVEGDGSEDQPVRVHLQKAATADELLAWLVAHGARVDRFERLATPLEEIFVRVAEGADSTLEIS